VKSAGLYAGWPDERAARLVSELVRSLTTGTIPTPEDEPGTGVAILRQGDATFNEVGWAFDDIGAAAGWDPARLLACYFIAVAVGERQRPLPSERPRTVETFPLTRGLAPLLADVRDAMREPDGRTFAFVNMHKWSGWDDLWPTEEGDTLVALDEAAYVDNVRKRAELARAGALG